MTPSEAMMADVRRVDYNPIIKRGRVFMGGVSCTDMTGAIQFFTEIDPGVKWIETINEEGPDTVYVRTADGWRASNVR